MLSLWQSGAYRLMDDDVPYPSALPTAEGAPTPYKDDYGAVRPRRAGPSSLAAPAPPTGLPAAQEHQPPASKIPSPKNNTPNISVPN